jgi:hypothetical protein
MMIKINTSRSVVTVGREGVLLLRAAESKWRQNENFK